MARRFVAGKQGVAAVDGDEMIDTGGLDRL
jgi:hypothetical protein